MHLTNVFAMFLLLSGGIVAPVYAQDSHDIGSTAPVSARQPVVLNIEEIAEDLALTKAPVEGLRQKVLLNEPLTTIILLNFEKDGKKLDHTAPGIATITVINGSVDFQVLGKTHSLTAGQVIVIQPDVVHNLTAKEASNVLVTISKGSGGTTAHKH